MGKGFTLRRLPGRVRRGAVLGGLAVGVIGLAWWWSGVRERARIAEAVPSRPVAAVPVGLAEAIAAAELAARAGDPAGLAELALLYQANGYNSEALQGYAALIELAPKETVWAERLARLQSGADPGASWFEELDERCFSPGRLMAAAGEAAAVGDNERAQARLRRALALAPDDGALRMEAAFRWEGLRNQVQALAEYEVAVRLRPDLEEAWLRLITLQRAIGETTKASRLLGEALAANPESARLRLENARALAGRGRLEPALAEFDRVVALEPGAAVAHVEAAQVLFTLERREAARARLEQALSVAPQHPVALVLLTLAAITDRDRPAADRWFARLVASPQVAPQDRARLAAGYAEAFGASVVQPAPPAP